MSRRPVPGWSDVAVVAVVVVRLLNCPADCCWSWRQWSWRHPDTPTRKSSLKPTTSTRLRLCNRRFFFTTDQARIVLHLKVPDSRVGDLTPEQIAEEQNVTRNPCLGLDRPRNPLNNMHHPECGNILSMVQTLFTRDSRMLRASLPSSGRLFVRLSVCHTRELYQNGAS